MRRGKTKLLLYDKYLKAITVDANVLPERMYVCYEVCIEGE